MWWLVELLAALAAARYDSEHAVLSSAPRRSENSSVVVTYRSRDGSTFFRFRLSPLGSDIRIHILEFPNPDAGSCHVLHDDSGPYICWSRSISSMAEAKVVAGIWAEATIVYQRRGLSF